MLLSQDSYQPYCSLLCRKNNTMTQPRWTVGLTEIWFFLLFCASNSKPPSFHQKFRKTSQVSELQKKSENGLRDFSLEPNEVVLKFGSNWLNSHWEVNYMLVSSAQRDSKKTFILCPDLPTGESSSLKISQLWKIRFTSSRNSSLSLYLNTRIIKT